MRRSGEFSAPTTAKSPDFRDAFGSNAQSRPECPDLRADARLPWRLGIKDPRKDGHAVPPGHARKDERAPVRVGDRHRARPLRCLVAELGVADLVTFAGVTTDVGAHLRRADVLVRPS